MKCSVSYRPGPVRHLRRQCQVGIASRVGTERFSCLAIKHVPRILWLPVLPFHLHSLGGKTSYNHGWFPSSTHQDPDGWAEGWVFRRPEGKWTNKKAELSLLRPCDVTMAFVESLGPRLEMARDGPKPASGGAARRVWTRPPAGEGGGETPGFFYQWASFQVRTI